MSDSIRLSSVALDCPHAGDLARFYAAITGGRITFLHETWATVQTAGGRIELQTSPGFVTPSWPGGPTPAQVHLDFLVDDLDRAGDRVLAAGATRFAVQPNAEHCHVFADPVGHPFCLTLWDDVPAEGQEAPSDG